MKKKIYFIGIAVLSLFVSCNKEEIAPPIDEIKLFQPTVKGEFGKINDANGETKTRSGVIENNTDYKDAGESFYWHHGDSVKLLFFKDGILSNEPKELIYTAVVVDNQKNSSADFVTTGEIEAGSYTVYGLYPAKGWTKEGNEYKVTMSDSTITQADASSKHLGRNMFMKAKAENITIGEGLPNTFDLNYKHLGSVIRFHVRNNNLSGYTTLNNVVMTVRNLNSPVEFYPFSAVLADGIKGDSLIPTKLLDSIKINVTNGLSYDFFIPILSNGGFKSGDSLIISGILSNDNPLNNVPLRLSLPILDSLSFLTNGFMPSRSFYFSATKW